MRFRKDQGSGPNSFASKLKKYWKKLTGAHVVRAMAEFTKMYRDAEHRIAVWT